MSKWFRNFIAFLAAFCMLFGSLPVSAAVKGDETTVTFTNVKNESPDLYVKKHVESADERYPVPADARFTFALKLDGKAAANLTYRVFDKFNNEVFRYESGESTEDKPNKLPYKTKSDGTFTLGAEQTAKFEYVGAGRRYEVTEKEQEHYQQKIPAPGTSASGTISLDGAVVEFTNVYVPDTGAGKGQMKISKSVMFPEGVALPYENVSFLFRLTLDGERYGNEKFQIQNNSTLEIREGMTEGDGTFRLMAGETAMFSEIPVDVDYRVEELLEDGSGWTVVGGNRVQEGATSSITLVSFTNRNASFGVRKKLSEGSTDKEFSFVLSREDKTPFVGAAYYRYKADGSLYRDSSGNVARFFVDEKGRFSLKQNELAIFAGIAPGTRYSVYEEANPQYVQVVPSGADGYVNQTVADHSVAILDFVNQRIEEGTLSVTKGVSNVTGDISNASFSFILESSDSADGPWAPMGNQVYGVVENGKESTFQTDEKGRFTLQANRTAVFKRLSRNKFYRVTEVKDEESDFKLDLSVDGMNDVQTGQLSREDGTLSFYFQNRYVPQMVELVVRKLTKENQPLSGAVFQLYSNKELTKPAGGPYESDDGGKLTFTGLRPGTYYLKETRSPAGYRLLADVISLELEWDYENEKMVVSVNGKKNDPSLSYEPDGKHRPVLTVYNYKGFTLPLVGGSGILFWELGALAGIVALCFFGFRKAGKKSSE